jgi:hypothetical protein
MNCPKCEKKLKVLLAGKTISYGCFHCENEYYDTGDGILKYVDELKNLKEVKKSG